MDKLQIAHDLAVAKLCAELPGSLDNSHICQRNTAQNLPTFWIPTMKITFSMNWIKRK